ncbi:MAG: hypothetical protein ACI33M_08385 [Lysinibacillus sp.]
MTYSFNQHFRLAKTFTALTVIAAITLFLFLAFLPNPPTAPNPTKQLVAVNLAASYLQRLQTEQSITEPTYFEDRLKINDQLYKIEVMATTTEHPNTLSITVNAFSADHQFKGAAEGYVEIPYVQNET